MKKPKKAKGKKSVSKALKSKAKKVVRRVLAKVKAATAKPRKEPAKQKRLARRASPRKLKVEQVVRESEEEPMKPPALSPTNLFVRTDNHNLDDEVMVDEPEEPPYEEPKVANDWRGPFVEAAPVGWQSKHSIPGFKVA